uniref:Uncharacterized protein n=1 Tax=Ananas comosus var. bracteatus TaxID=296719 RepID=A0A6V7PZA0_ANACO|nr:unnamed protein product [Ananas comosus var. bracteatus]
MVPQSPNMVSAPDVVDISSDEEDCGFGWISDLLDGVGEESEGFDDVMVVDDLSAPPVVLPRRNPKSGRSRKGGEREGSDDECQVLDSDPSNPVSVVDDGRGSDELLIVGEKGPLACRDFPHPRHSCANFPFSSTSHEKHCNMCHCYVCDSLAPCSYWGNGSSSSDHCHSNDKDESWKSLRQSFKRKKYSAPQPPNLQNGPPPVAQSMQHPPQLRQPPPMLRPPPFSQPNIVRPCSTTVATATITPSTNSIGQRQSPCPLIISCNGQRSVQTPGKTYTLSPKTLCARREKGTPGALSAQLMYSRTRFKRSGTAPPVISNIATGRSHPPQVTSRGTRFPQVSIKRMSSILQRSQSQPVRSAESSSNMIQLTTPNETHSTTVPSPRTQCSPVSLADLSTKSWEDILASVAPEHGVSISPQPSLTNKGQEMNIFGPDSPDTVNLNSLDVDNWLSPTSVQNGESHRQENPSDQLYSHRIQ